ncbi:MAG: cobalt ECF transporter T component CbiQ [Ardenticatenaceae bacterium]|nr:cobalt ECF transporter T component CbiQ [Anaerolineales bacterium]MCB8918854.1 cobalt ECF transporter T component CbiQ [Ardenticatenaceae bacterium]
MHVNTFDRYEARHSLIHRLDPRVKVIITVAFIFANVLLPDGAWLAFLASWAMLLLVQRLAQLSWGYAFRRSFVALPFVLAAVTVVFNLPGRAVWIINVGSWQLVATDAGLLRFFSIVVRSWLSVQMAILLTATTQFPDLIHALRHLYVPQPIVSIISFMYRYMFVMVDEAGRLMRAREARSARPPGGGGGGSIAWRARVTGNMAGQLFLRSYERSDRVYNAMLARGYQGHLLTINQHQMKRQDWLIGGLALLVLLLIQLLGRL